MIKITFLRAFLALSTVAALGVLPACGGPGDVGNGGGSDNGNGGNTGGGNGGGGGGGDIGGGGGNTGGGGGGGSSDDTGATCTDNSDCRNHTCLKGVDENGNFTDFGYCTKPCESFADCPTFWDCTEVGNSVGTFCVQN